jgi:hypothetical protein
MERILGSLMEEEMGPLMRLPMGEKSEPLIRMTALSAHLQVEFFLTLTIMAF